MNFSDVRSTGDHTYSAPIPWTIKKENTNEDSVSLNVEGITNKASMSSDIKEENINNDFVSSNMTDEATIMTLEHKR